MPELSASLADYALERMRARGVTSELNARVSALRPGVVVLKRLELEKTDATKKPEPVQLEIPAETLVWVGGAAPNPLLKQLAVERDKRGAVLVENTLAVRGHTGRREPGGGAPTLAPRCTTQTRGCSVADIGLTFLDAPVQGIVPATLAVNGDEGDPDWAGERLKQVGYGLLEAPLPGTLVFGGLFDGVRRIGMSSVDVIDQNWLSYNRDPSGTCHGDSELRRSSMARSSTSLPMGTTTVQPEMFEHVSTPKRYASGFTTR